MDAKWKKWIDAGIQFDADRGAKIICPECEKGILVLIIEPFGKDKQDWYMKCDGCGKWNVATKPNPE